MCYYVLPVLLVLLVPLVLLLVLVLPVLLVLLILPCSKQSKFQNTVVEKNANHGIFAPPNSTPVYSNVLQCTPVYSSVVQCGPV